MLTSEDISNMRLVCCGYYKTFLIYVYIYILRYKNWFCLYWNHTCLCGLLSKQVNTLQTAQNLFTKQYSLLDVCQNICLMLSTLWSNGMFFSHPDHLLLVITQDDEKSTREFGLQRIQKARLIEARGKTVRTFMAPKINFSVEEYSEITKWIHCVDPNYLLSHCLQKSVTTRSNHSSTGTQSPPGSLLSSKS